MARAGRAGRAPMPPAARRRAKRASSPRSGGAGVVSAAISDSVSLFSPLVLSSVVSSSTFLAASVVAWM